MPGFVGKESREMIYVEKNEANNIPLTLSEKSRLAAPIFLFEFILEYERKEEKTPIYFTAPDVSAYPLRVNVFQLTEGENGSETEANGFDELPEEGAHLKLKRGQYIYNVYESEAVTLDKAETTGRIIETGRMVVEITTDEEDKGQRATGLGVYD